MEPEFAATFVMHDEAEEVFDLRFMEAIEPTARSLIYLICALPRSRNLSGDYYTASVDEFADLVHAFDSV